MFVIFPTSIISKYTNLFYVSVKWSWMLVGRAELTCGDLLARLPARLLVPEEGDLHQLPRWQGRGGGGDGRNATQVISAANLRSVINIVEIVTGIPCTGTCTAGARWWRWKRGRPPRPGWWTQFAPQNLESSSCCCNPCPARRRNLECRI